MKKLLITGSNGMLGKALVSKLYQVKEIQLLMPSRSELDLCNQQAVKTYFSEHQVDMLIHLAGRVGGIAANIKSPYDFAYENCQMALNIINGAIEGNVPKLLNIGSSCMYPKDRELLKESDLLTGTLEPTNLGYALAKTASAYLCDFAASQYGVMYKTIIPCNLYGPYDNFDPETSHLIPAIIRKVLKAKEENTNVMIWGDGQARREFMYIEDLVDLILLSMKRFDELPQMMNAGLGYDFTVEAYYQAVAKLLDFKGQFEFDLTKPVGMMRKRLDVSLANTFGWKAKTALEDGLRKTISYYTQISEVVI